MRTPISVFPAPFYPLVPVKIRFIKDFKKDSGGIPGSLANPMMGDAKIKVTQNDPKNASINIAGHDSTPLAIYSDFDFALHGIHTEHVLQPKIL